MNMNIDAFRHGVQNGMPIALGYFAVAFTFGILAKQAGFHPFEAVFMSATNLTSAGQFAGMTMIASAATVLEIAVAQLIINSRYFLMSFALSQKIDPNTPLYHRFLLAFGITDEIFGVSIAVRGKLNPFYSYGLMSVAIPGWALGTLAGVVAGNMLPERLIHALSIALFAMLLAVIIPPAKDKRILRGLIICSMASSFLFSIIPVLSSMSSGVKIIVLTVVIATVASLLFPIEEDAYD